MLWTYTRCGIWWRIIINRVFRAEILEAALGGDGMIETILEARKGLQVYRLIWVCEAVGRGRGVKRDQIGAGIVQGVLTDILGRRKGIG